MNIEMDGKKVKSIYLDGDEYMFAEGKRTMTLSASTHGDRDDFWVLVYEDMIEVSRHNCKYISSIEWA